jgi:hypothetical protein
MRRTAAFALMISLALLSACGGAERAAAEDFRQRLSAAEQISFTADERAEYPGKTEEYTLRYSESGGEASVEVVKPDIIAGISARVKDGGGTLSYEGAELDTGPLPGGLTPISALPGADGGHEERAYRFRLAGGRIHGRPDHPGRRGNGDGLVRRRHGAPAGRRYAAGRP